MTEEYEPLEMKFETIGNKEDITAWVERLQKIVNLTKTPKLSLEVKLKELKPNKDWRPSKRTPTLEEMSLADKETKKAEP